MLVVSVRVFDEYERHVGVIDLPHDLELERVERVQTKAEIVANCEYAVQRADYLKWDLFFLNVNVHITKNNVCYTN